MRLLQNQEGFSLIEIMVALMLGLLLVMAFTGAFIVGLQTEADMDERFQAKYVADSIVEYIRENRYLLNDKILWSDVKDNFEYDEIKFIDDVVIDPDSSNDELYEVFITIEWTERGEERSYSLNALLSGD